MNDLGPAALLDLWREELPPRLREAEAYLASRELLSALPPELAVCPHGLEVAVSGVAPRAGVSFGFPFRFEAPHTMPTPARVLELTRPIFGPGPSWAHFEGLLRRIEACGWATTHPSTGRPRPRIVYLALTGGGPIEIVGSNIIFYDAWSEESIHQEQWRWLLGAPASSELADTLSAIRDATRGSKVGQVGLAQRPDRTTLKVYVRATYAEQLRALEAFHGAPVVPKGLRNFLADIPELTTFRVEDWERGRVVRMGMEITLEERPSLHEKLPSLLREVPDFEELDARLWSYIGAHPAPLSLARGDRLARMVSHLKVSARSDGSIEWKIYLLQYLLRARPSGRGALLDGLRKVFSALEPEDEEQT